MADYGDPDIFSLDIDGIDFFVATAMLEMGFRPKIFVVKVQFSAEPDQWTISSTRTSTLLSFIMAYQ